LAIDFKPFIRALVDLGSEDYEARVRKLILFGGFVVLALILVWKARLSWLK
jgi:hypothetical protein